MKKLITLCAVAIAAAISGCSNCKQCRVETMGLSTQAKEVCGEDLKKAEQAGMVCE